MSQIDSDAPQLKFKTPPNRRFLMHLLSFVVIIGGWELAGVFNQLNDLLLPPPSKIIYSLFQMMFVTGVIYWNFFVTLFEALAGFVIGCTIGMSLAIAAALNPTFRRYAAPYAVVFNVTPGIAVTPMIIAWFGFGWNSKIALAALICFFPPYVNTLTGLLHTDEDASDLFRSMGASKSQYFWKLQLPNAIPTIIAGLKLGMTGALIGTIVAEFASASEGVGILMQRFAFKLDIASSFATLLTMSLMGLMLFTLMEVLDDRVVFWKRDRRMLAVSKRRAAAWNKDKN